MHPSSFFLPSISFLPFPSISSLPSSQAKMKMNKKLVLILFYFPWPNILTQFSKIPWPQSSPQPKRREKLNQNRNPHGYPNSCSLTRKAGVLVHNFFRVTGTLHCGRGGSVFKCVCLFVCFFLCSFAHRSSYILQRVCFFVFFFQQLALG